MATYATDLTTVHLCDNDTDWSELSGHSSGSSPSQDSESYIHNASAVSQATGQATAQNAGMEYDYGSNITWTSGHCFLAWQMFAAPTNIQPWASGGMRFGVGSASGDMNFWNALGDNFGNYPYGGWQNTAIDPEVTVDQTDGTPTAGNYRYFGSLPNMRAKITKGSPHVIDAIRYGRGELQVTGTGATFAGMAAANDAATARWGLFQSTGGPYLYKGLMSLGLTATSVTFSVSNVSIRIEDTPRVSAGFNKIEINNASSNISWTSVSIAGVQTSITGSAPIAPGNFEVVDNATIAFDSCTFTDMGTFIFQSNSTLTTCTFRRCKKVTLGSGDFASCLFTKSPDTISVATATLNDLDGCRFESDGSNYGVDLGTISGNTSMAWDCTESGYVVGSSGDDVGVTPTGNETIYVSVASGVTLTINVSDTASTPSVANAGTGTVKVVSGQKTFAFTLNPSITGYEWRLYDVDAAGGLAGAVEIAGEEVATQDNQSYSYSYTADDVVAVQIISDDYVESITYYILGNSNQNITINLTWDNND